MWKNRERAERGIGKFQDGSIKRKKRTMPLDCTAPTIPL